MGRFLKKKHSVSQRGALGKNSMNKLRFKVIGQCKGSQNPLHLAYYLLNNLITAKFVIQIHHDYERRGRQGKQVGRFQ